MDLKRVRVAALCGGAVLLGGCPPPDGYVESTPPPEYSANSSGPSLAPADDPEPPRPPAEKPLEEEVLLEAQVDHDPPTTILDRAAADRLLSNSGVTLQWIGWEERGEMRASMIGETMWLSGGQGGKDDPRGGLWVSGRVVTIAADHFILDGHISIQNAPDQGRSCHLKKYMRFAITQNRKYWRLREFEWCDGLTDYIDIYF